MEARGKKLKARLKELGYNIRFFANVLGKDEVYIYQLLDRDDLSWDIIRKIGQHINYDFRKDFPDMPFEYQEYPDTSTKAEEPLPLEYEVKKWRDKYFKLLEDVSDMLREKKNEEFLVKQST